MAQILGTLTSYLAQYFIVSMVWLAGAILSIIYWQRHPKVSRLTLIAIAIFLVASLVSTYTNLYLPILLRDLGWTDGQLTLYYPLHSIVVSLSQAVGWGFILAAIFTRRDES